MSDFLQGAYALSGEKAGLPLTDEAEIRAMLRAPDLAWLHLQADHKGTHSWLTEHIDYLDQHALIALLADETRPRAEPVDNGALVILRGVNTNPDQDPDDMVSIRLWIDDARIISLARRPLAALADIREALGAGRGPQTAGDFLCLLVERLNARIEDFLRELDDRTDAIEEEVNSGPSPELRRRITDTRRQAITLRRYVAPQRDALAVMSRTKIGFIAKREQRRLAEAEDRMQRTIEDLDAMRERLAVVKDELASALSERLNRNLYLLSLVTAVFLPLGFLTGMFGINLAGMPGAEWDGAFWTFAGLLAVILVLQILLLRLMRWF